MYGLTEVRGILLKLQIARIECDMSQEDLAYWFCIRHSILVQYERSAKYRKKLNEEDE